MISHPIARCNPFYQLLFRKMYRAFVAALIAFGASTPFTTDAESNGTPHFRRGRNWSISQLRFS
jgi:hypothetical protein